VNVQLLDYVDLGKQVLKKDPVSGFLRIPVALTCVQVRDYPEISRPDGRMGTKIAFPNQTIQDAAPTFNDVPVVVHHGVDWVTTGNFRDRAVGHVSSGVRFDEKTKHLRGEVIISDEKTIKEVLGRKQYREVSIGAPGAIEFQACYLLQDGTLSFDPNSGGEPADAWCSGMTGNHLALVPQGRAGASCRLLIDHDTPPKGGEPKPNQGANVKIKITLPIYLADGKPVVEQREVEFEDTVEPLVAVFRDREARIKAQIDLTDTSRRTAEERAKQAEAKLKDAEDKAKELVPKKEVAAMVQDHLVAMGAAQNLRIEIKDGQGAMEIKLAVIEQLLPSVRQHLKDSKHDQEATHVDIAFKASTANLRDAAEMALINKAMKGGMQQQTGFNDAPVAKTPRQIHEERYNP